MKIAMLATGGTIGSEQKQSGWIAPNQQAPYQVVQMFHGKYPELAAKVEIDCRMPYQILSENLEAEYLIRLLDEIHDCVAAGAYDGILIAHGTDTLQYTAAMVEYIYGKGDVPILLVSSNYPLEDERANGIHNFYYAIRSLLEGFRGVGVVYRNSDGNTYIHRGDRLCEHTVFEDDLYSIRNQVAGYYDIEGTWISGALEQPEQTDAPMPSCLEYQSLKHDSGILWLHNAPGNSYHGLLQLKGIKAILLQCYHAGTIRIDAAFRLFVNQAAKQGISVYLVGVEELEGGYETKKAYAECGVMVMEKLAPIAAYCRLWLELSRL